MQDLRSIGGGNGRIFSTGADRRMRAVHPQQPLKCPRCESLNTKFCYYNNYNLSQPRHFCKSCRRYWTKGGVLRNVPVGGGCRKPKRSSKPKPSSSPSPPPDRNSASHSSSDSSTLTAATNNTNTPPPVVAAAAAATPAAEVASAPSSSTVLNYVNPAVFEVMEGFCQASDPAGSFTSLMTGSNPGAAGFGFGDLAGNATFPFEFQQQKMVEEMKMQDLTFLDQTAVQQQQQLGENRESNGGDLTALEWQSNGDHHHQGLFDLAAGVVLDQAYWSSNTQWGDNDHALFLP